MISSLCSSTEQQIYPGGQKPLTSRFNVPAHMYNDTYQSGTQRNMMPAQAQPVLGAMPVSWSGNSNLSLDSIRMNTSASNATVSHSNGVSMQQRQQQQQQQQQMHSSSAYTGVGEGTGNNSLPQLSMGDLACLDAEPQGQVRQEGQGAFGIRKATTTCDQPMMQSHWNAAPCTSFYMECEDNFLQSLIGTQPSSTLPKQEQPVAMMAPSASASADCQQSFTTLLSCSTNNGSAQEAMRQVTGRAGNGQSTIDQEALWFQQNWSKEIPF